MGPAQPHVAPAMGSVEQPHRWRLLVVGLNSPVPVPPHNAIASKKTSRARPRAGSSRGRGRAGTPESTRRQRRVERPGADVQRLGARDQHARAPGRPRGAPLRRGAERSAASVLGDPGWTPAAPVTPASPRGLLVGAALALWSGTGKGECKPTPSRCHRWGCSADPMAASTDGCVGHMGGSPEAASPTPRAASTQWGGLRRLHGGPAPRHGGREGRHPGARLASGVSCSRGSRLGPGRATRAREVFSSARALRCGAAGEFNQQADAIDWLLR